MKESSLAWKPLSPRGFLISSMCRLAESLLPGTGALKRFRLWIADSTTSSTLGILSRSAGRPGRAAGNAFRCAGIASARIAIIGAAPSQQHEANRKHP